jgi:uncharacterized membrane protein YqjE
VADRHRPGPVRPGDRSLAEIVGDISQKTSLLVREEIELAKTELTEKASRLGRGAAVGAAAGVFAFLAVIFFLHFLSLFIADVLDGDLSPSVGFWAGYLIVTGLLLVLAAVAGLIALRYVRRGSPPTPEAAIEEAKITRQVIEEEVRN